ncbi:MAG: hypothetical protein ACTHOJ_09535 [Sphingomonas oligoaromativorans]
MATVRDFEIKDLDRVTAHSDVEATISFVECDGEKFVQIDTYGSKGRAIPGKMSQSLRLSEAAFRKLSALAGKHF